jgi:hypothetical protein
VLHDPLLGMADELGRPGCDNKLNYLFRLLNYEVYNDPEFIRTYHCHKETARSYQHEAIKPPYMLSIPARLSTYRGDDIKKITQELSVHDLPNGNLLLFRYITYCFDKKKPFIVPRVAGVENNAAVHYYTSRNPLPDRAVEVLKNNAGILLHKEEDLQYFAKWYLQAFDSADLYASWEQWSHYTNHIQQSQEYVQRLYPKQQMSTGVFDIFHFIASGNPWTHALRNRRILLISPFGETMLTQEQAYPIDLFPECSFVHLKPPMTQGSENNRGFKTEFLEFCSRVRNVKFDVALVSCGGYGNPICSYIYSLGKSAIYVGGVLQMYFGLYGSRWIKERKDVLRLYMTKTWRRPTEKPLGYEKIENGCYW